MGFSSIASMVGVGASVASLGMSAASKAVSGQAVQVQDYTAAQNYQLQAQAQAQNALLSGSTQAANYSYAGAQQQAQFGLESGQLSEEASSNTAAAQAGELQAAMVDVSARQQLTQTLGNIATISAAGHTDLTSPTTEALMGYNYNVSELNRTSQEATINTQVAQEQAAAAYETASSQFALTQGANAEAMGAANAAMATAFGTYNADVALQYGNYNYAQAEAAGNMGLTMGYFGASSAVLGGISTAFTNVPSPSTAPAQPISNQELMPYVYDTPPATAPVA